MAKVNWSSEYSVKIEEIDDQHKVIVDMINDLDFAITNNHDRETVGQIITRLIDYTKVHFAIEESLMRLFAYPDYEQHKKVHENLVRRVLAFQDQFEKGNAQIGMELLYFLKDWLLGHIMKVDKQYSPFMLAHGIECKKAS